MGKIVVGRKAMNTWSIHRKSDRPTDLDVWTDSRDYLPDGREDVCVMPGEVMFDFSYESQIWGVAVNRDLLAIKLSHLTYDIFWWKHVQDVLVLSQRTSGRYNRILYNTLKEHWKVEHGNKDFLSLYKTKDEFFDDFVPKQHEHDLLHEMVAYPEKPVYTTCLKDGHEVFIDRNKFNNLPMYSQIRMFKEEIAVIALERWLIPQLTNKGQSITIQQAWNKSLHKTVTVLTKGWASEFIILNLEHFLKPLHTEMMNVLEKLNLKEIYMSKTISLETLKELLSTKVDTESYYFRNVDMSDAEAVAEAREAAMDEFSSILADGDFLEEGVFVEQDGGGEGGAEDCYTVFNIDGVFYKVLYSYYSHYGYELDYATVQKVTPKKQTITVYE